MRGRPACSRGDAVPSTKAYVLVVAAAILQRTTGSREGVALETPVKIFVFAVLFLAGQRYIGNAAHPLVRTLAEHETFVVVAFWSMGLIDLAIAMPVAIKDGFFGPGARAVTCTWSRRTSACRPARGRARSWTRR